MAEAWQVDGDYFECCIVIAARKGEPPGEVRKQLNGAGYPRRRPRLRQRRSHCLKRHVSARLTVAS